MDKKDKKNKITIDLSELHYNNEYCELEYKFDNVILQFPRVHIKKLELYNENKENAVRDGLGALIIKTSSDLINSISGNYEFIPLIDEDGVQYRKIIEVKE